MTTIYAAAVRDEIWIGGALLESRAGWGQARQNGKEIIASDRLDDASLRTACDAEMQRVRDIAGAIDDARLRIVVRATTDGLESTVSITMGSVSIVTTPQFAIADAHALRGLLSRPPTPDPRPPAPLVWRNGSAAILLHEAAGHAAENGHQSIPWPQWLRVRDGEADLLAGQSPRRLRRESFRDVPLPRMTSVVVEQRNAPFDPPRHCVDIHLIAGGSYEPLTEMVSIHVAVAESGGKVLQPFEIRASREEISRAMLGATGEPIRYPGVICSREGQELFVGSYAPVILTTELG